MQSDTYIYTFANILQTHRQDRAGGGLRTARSKKHWIKYKFNINTLYEICVWQIFKLQIKHLPHEGVGASGVIIGAEP